MTFSPLMTSILNGGIPFPAEHFVSRRSKHYFPSFRATLVLRYLLDSCLVNVPQLEEDQNIWMLALAQAFLVSQVARETESGTVRSGRRVSE